MYIAKDILIKTAVRRSLFLLKWTDKTFISIKSEL